MRYNMGTLIPRKALVIVLPFSLTLRSKSFVGWEYDDKASHEVPIIAKKILRAKRLK